VVTQHPDDGSSNYLRNVSRHTYETTRRNMPEDSHVHTHRCKNLKSQNVRYFVESGGHKVILFVQKFHDRVSINHFTVLHPIRSCSVKSLLFSSIKHVLVPDDRLWNPTSPRDVSTRCGSLRSTTPTRSIKTDTVLTGSKTSQRPTGQVRYYFQ
jgi:hypothetical protein